MSLESGVTLCRLNHELLPEPGSPIARTTMPFGGRGAAAGTAAGTCGACGTDAAGACGFGALPGASATPSVRQIPSAARDNTFDGGGCEGLSYGLLATASSASTATTTATSAVPRGPSPLVAGRPDCRSSCGLSASRLRFDFGSFRIRALARGLARGSLPPVLPALLRIEIRGLQGRRRRLVCPAPGLSFCGAVGDRASIYACSGL